MGPYCIPSSKNLGQHSSYSTARTLAAAGLVSSAQTDKQYLLVDIYNNRDRGDRGEEVTETCVGERDVLERETGREGEIKNTYWYVRKTTERGIARTTWYKRERGGWQRREGGAGQTWITGYIPSLTLSLPLTWCREGRAAAVLLCRAPLLLCCCCCVAVVLLPWQWCCSWYNCWYVPLCMCVCYCRLARVGIGLFEILIL